MTINYNVNVVSSDLVLNLDAGNSRSLFNVNVNLLTNSETFDNAVWTKFNTSIVANQASAPDGSVTADTITESIDAAATYHSLLQSVSLTAGTYTLSAYVKPAGTDTTFNGFELGLAGGSNFNLNTGIKNFDFGGNVGGIIDVGNGWFRVYTTATVTSASYQMQLVLSAATGSTNYQGSGRGRIYVWGEQLEAGTAVSAYLPVSSGASSTAWNDISGNGFHGTLINGPTYSSTNRGYLNFDYTKSQYVSFPKNPAIELLNTSSYTLESWFRITVNPGTGNYTGIFDREDTSVGAVRDGWNLFVVEQSAGILLISHERFAQGTQLSVGTTGTVAELVGVWLHIAVTYNGITMSMYKNGSLVVSGPTTAQIKNNIKNLTIGRRGDNYFRGQIAVARIYSRALSATEVLQNFNALRGRYGV